MYLPGERVNLSCSAPGAQEVTGYRFYKRQPEQGSEELPASRGGPRWEILAAVGDEGPYTCRYWSRGPGRELPSGLSQPIAIRVTGEALLLGAIGKSGWYPGSSWVPPRELSVCPSIGPWLIPTNQWWGCSTRDPP